MNVRDTVPASDGPSTISTAALQAPGSTTVDDANTGESPSTNVNASSVLFLTVHVTAVTPANA